MEDFCRGNLDQQFSVILFITIERFKLNYSRMKQSVLCTLYFTHELARQWRIQGEGARDARPLGPNSFIFMQFSPNILQYNMVGTPILGIGAPPPPKNLRSSLQELTSKRLQPPFRVLAFCYLFKPKILKLLRNNKGKNSINNDMEFR